MRKTTAAAISLMALALAVGGCSTPTTPAPGGSGAAPVQARTIKVADTWSATHPIAKAVENVFKAEIESKTNGAIKLEVYHSGQLGNEQELWDGVRNGTLEVSVVGSVMNSEFSEMLISDWPFLYRDIAHAQKVWTGPVADEVSADFHAKFPTTEILGWGPNSARTFTSNKPLASLEDFRGQKFRMPANPIHVGIVENLGASAQVIPLGELFTALETGVVDGQDNGMVTVRSEALYEVQKYLLETNHIVATMEIIASESFMESLTPEQQQIVRDAGKKAAAQAWTDYIASVDTDRQFLKDNGVTVNPFTAEDRERMITVIKPVTDKLYAENAWAKGLVDKIAAVS